MPIPTTLHQIWMGPYAPPEWMNAWSALPSWEYQLWDHTRIDELMYSRSSLTELYNRYIEDKCYNGAANIARLEILRTQGGVYVDADTEYASDFAGAEFMGYDAWVVHSPNVDPVSESVPGRLVNGIMAGVRNHPFLRSYIRALEKVSGEIHPSWKKTGGELMTEIFNRRRSDELIPVLPAHTFLPFDLKRRRIGPTTYGIHHYGTTRGLYRRRQ